MMQNFPLRIKCRPQTQDEMCVKEVFFGNEYMLPEMFMPGDLIMDLGANIGSFTLACLERGAKNIWCYEPDRDNFAWLKKNLQDNLPRWPDANVQLLQAAVWGAYPVRRRRFQRPGDYFTACSRVVLDEDKNTPTDYWVDTVAFDDEVNKIVERHKIAGLEQKRIRFCKMDVEGSECAIIPTSKTLHLIDEIALEYHGDVWEPLRGFLAEAGFQVEVDQRNNPNVPGNVQGLIFGHQAVVGHDALTVWHYRPNPDLVECSRLSGDPCRHSVTDMSEDVTCPECIAKLKKATSPQWPREIVPNALEVKVTHGS